MSQVDRSRLGHVVGRFMSQMHRYDGGRTLPLLYAAKLSTPQLAVLEFVRAPRTVSAAAAHVGLSRPATSQLINKLVRHRLVSRSEGALDRREKDVALSAKGRALLDRIAAARAARFDASLAALPPRLAARLAGVLIDVVDALDKRRPASQTVDRPC